MTVCVVGAGIAGTACAQVLRAAGHDVRLLDRGRMPGGRMASRRLHGRYVDLGASYFTVSDDRFAVVVEDWVQRGLARTWTDVLHTAGPDGVGAARQGPVRYAAGGGLRSLVADLAEGVEPQSEVRRVGPGPIVDGQPYDAVVLAMPDPQALRLLDPDCGARALLADRAWQPVLALAAGFDRRTWDFDGCFVNDDQVLSWVADDGSRRGDGAAVLVAHSAAEFAAARLGEPAAAGPELVAALRRVVGLPEPGWSLVQRWTYARPVGERDEPYGLAEGIGLCGDGWGAAKVQAAWLSGHLLGAALSQPGVLFGSLDAR